MTHVCAARILPRTLRHDSRRVAYAIWLGLLVVTGAACSLLLDTSGEQCTSDVDCAGKFVHAQCINRVCVSADAGGPIVDASGDSPTDGALDATVDAGPWGCLGKVAPSTSPSISVNVVVPLVDLTTQQPVTSVDVTANVCARIDVTCTNPLTNGDGGVQVLPDPMGLLHLSLPAGFDGFVRIDPVFPAADAAATDPDAGVPNVFVPSLVFFNPRIDHDLVYTTVVMVRRSELAQIAQIEGTVIDPSVGAVFLATDDCQGKPAPGVSVSLDSTGPSTQGFYFFNGLPVLNGASTDSTGYAGFMNAPLGSRVVSGKVAATGQEIGTTAVFTRPSTISYTVLAPSP